MTVTTPLLPAASAAKRNRVLSLSVKFAVAGAATCAATVSVNACAAAGFTVAVTTLTPPLSAIVSGDSTSVTTGVPSSSVIVTVCGSPIAAPWSRAVTTICSPLSSTWSSTAVMVAVTSLAPTARVTR